MAAVEAFHKEMGRYPTDLDELVPEYVSEIPETIAGKEFTFEENDGDIFYVSFPVTTKTTIDVKKKI